MSSGQWEVVGKSKKSQNGKVKSVNTEDKKSVKNGPKVEDALQSQPKSFYSGMEIDDGRPSKKKDGDKKKKQDKKAEKPKPPTTIEGALESIDPAELANIITTNKIRFSNAPLVWLKEVANFLNSKIQIEVEDPTFSSYPSSYPSSKLPTDIKNLLEDVLKNAGKANAQLFFDVTLTAMANDMSRGQLVNGHRLLLQMLAQDYPEFCVSSVQKSASLRNSYQNRPPIGLSLLWAFGQGGRSDFDVGMKAWQELFLPVIELKSYSKYVVTYLSNILDGHSAKAGAKVNQDQLLAMLDLVNSKKNGLPKDLSSDLIKQLSKYKDIYFITSGNKLQVTFNQIMKKLPNQYLSGSTLDQYNQVLVECLIDCLQKDDSCNATWRQLFHKCSKQSATILEYIDSNWSVVSKRLKQKSLKATVIQFKEVSGDTLKGKKKDETVVKANTICQDILDRMTSTRRFPWLWASFLLLGLIAGLVAYDVSRVGGNFPKSATGKLFNDLGILEQSQWAWQKSLSASARGYLWVETNAPIYYTKTVEVCKPYGQLSVDAFTIAMKKAGILYGNVKDYVVEKTPVVVSTIDYYAPGLVENVQGYASSGFAAVKKYSNDYYLLTADYLKTKVFVMEEKNLVQRGNTLQAILGVTNYNTPFATKTTPEYIISGAAVFQVKVIAAQVNNGHTNIYNNLIFVRFVKLRELDDLTYTIKFSSNEFGIANKNFISDDGTWHLVHDNKKQQYTFDVAIHMDIVPSTSSFATLHSDMELTDFELRGEDGSVHMHKAVLAASSPVLRRMLGGTWRETTEGHVDVPGTSKTTLQHLKDYVYLHILPETGLEQLLLLSSYYMMPDLEQRCVDKLVNSLTAQNTCDLLEFAAKHKVTRFLLAILECIQSGAVKVDEMRDHFLRGE